MRLRVLMVISVVLLVVVLAVVLSSALSYKIGIDDYVVQIWQPGTVSGDPEILLAYGIVVDDGNHVLTVLDYERDTPDKLLVVHKYWRHDASIQAIDYRTSATLLQLQDADLPTAEIGDTSSLASNQRVYVGGCIIYWPNRYMKCSANAYISAYISDNISPLFFSISIPWKTMYVITKGKDWVSESGAVITDKDGKAIGLVGRYLSELEPPPPYPPGYVYLPWAINISSALELLTDTSHTNGPAVSIVLAKYYWINIVPGDALPVNDIENLYNTVMGLLDKLGEPLPLDDLAQYPSGLSSGFYLEEGIMLVETFTYPVELHDSGNNLLARAKWIGIHWDRSEGKPNRLIYGSTAYIVEGVYSIEGDISGLVQFLEPIWPEPGHTGVVL